MLFEKMLATFSIIYLSLSVFHLFTGLGNLSHVGWKKTKKCASSFMAFIGAWLLNKLNEQPENERMNFVQYFTAPFSSFCYFIFCLIAFVRIKRK
jgi:hypothetical protein